MINLCEIVEILGWENMFSSNGAVSDAEAKQTIPPTTPKTSHSPCITRGNYETWFFLF